MKNRKIIEYIIIENSDSPELREEVNACISVHGFQPFGPICVAYNSTEEYFQYVQAMVRYKE